MGLPYSKQINAAFDQVTPLVAAGYQVLQTTRDISILLAAIQVLTVLLLALILVALLALLITVNPDLEHERQAVVTPAIKWIAGVAEWMSQFSLAFAVMLGVVAAGCLIGGLAGMWYTSRDPTLQVQEDTETTGADVEELKGDDIEAIKKGETKQ